MENKKEEGNKWWVGKSERRRGIEKSGGKQKNGKEEKNVGKEVEDKVQRRNGDSEEVKKGSRMVVTWEW